LNVTLEKPWYNIRLLSWRSVALFHVSNFTINSVMALILSCCPSDGSPSYLPSKRTLVPSRYGRAPISPKWLLRWVLRGSNCHQHGNHPSVPSFSYLWIQTLVYA